MFLKVQSTIIHQKNKINTKWTRDLHNSPDYKLQVPRKAFHCSQTMTYEKREMTITLKIKIWKLFFFLFSRFPIFYDLCIFKILNIYIGFIPIKEMQTSEVVKVLWKMRNVMYKVMVILVSFLWQYHPNFRWIFAINWKIKIGEFFYYFSHSIQHKKPRIFHKNLTTSRGGRGGLHILNWEKVLTSRWKQFSDF